MFDVVEYELWLLVAVWKASTVLGTLNAAFVMSGVVSVASRVAHELYYIGSIMTLKFTH